jgi:hypothetical protein
VSLTFTHRTSLPADQSLDQWVWVPTKSIMAPVYLSLAGASWLLSSPAYDRGESDGLPNADPSPCGSKGMFGSRLVSWLKLVRLKSFSHPLVWKQELKCIKRALKSLFLSPFLFSLLSQGGHGLELLTACMWSLMRKEEEEILVPFSSPAPY